MLLLDATFDVSKGTAWLKDSAPENMNAMLVTVDVSKSNGWLKDVAPRNMELIDIKGTLDVSKCTGLLKEAAPFNILDMSVTLMLPSKFQQEKSQK